MAAQWHREGTLINALIDRSGFTRQEIAAALGVSDDVVHNLCTGRSKLKGPRLVLFATKIGKPVDELREELRKTAPRTDAYSASGSSGDASSETSKPSVLEAIAPYGAEKAKKDAPTTVTVRGKVVIVPVGQKPVPVYGGVPAGQPGRSFSDAADVEFVNLSSTGALWGKVVEGGSMEGEFQPRDVVIFEEIAPMPNQIVYATKDGDDAFKLLREDKDGSGWLVPLNSDGYEKFPASDWQMHGVVRARIRYYPNGVRETREYPTHLKWKLPTQRS